MMNKKDCSMMHKIWHSILKLKVHWVKFSIHSKELNMYHSNSFFLQKYFLCKKMDPFGCSTAASQQQMALNFELVVNDQLFSVVLASCKWFKISAPGVVMRHMWQLDEHPRIWKAIYLAQCDLFFCILDSNSKHHLILVCQSNDDLHFQGACVCPTTI